jgi:hypothetical protein
VPLTLVAVPFLVRALPALGDLHLGRRHLLALDQAANRSLRALAVGCR